MAEIFVSALRHRSPNRLFNGGFMLIVAQDRTGFGGPMWRAYYEDTVNGRVLYEIYEGGIGMIAQRQGWATTTTGSVLRGILAGWR